MIVNQDIYRALYRIRKFEETVLENFPKGVFFGTTHTYLGQEANAVGVLSHLRDMDIVFSNHRCHGHFLAYGGNFHPLLAELMGRTTGVCGGRGGSQHLQWRNFYSNGVQGGIVPIATGMALAEKFKQTDAVTIVFLGDGTFGEGIVYEAFNMAALWQVPILYVVENNHIAQTTPIDLTLAGEIKDRFRAFGIPSCQLDTCDVLEIYRVAGEQLEAVRGQPSPRALILETHRFGPHSKGDDTRPPELIAAMRRQFDPLDLHGARIGSEIRELIESEVDHEVTSAFQRALLDPFPELELSE